MISKVIHIKNVGKFTDYSVNTTPTWNGEFRHITLVYGQNGIGKTTFTSILKSLKENDALLYQLRTFGTLNSPEVSIKFDDHPTPIKYSNAEWDTNFPIIEIFDIHFINDNVYTGFEILPQHKKNLFEIIIGQEGIRSKKEISDIKNSIKEKNISLKEIEAKVFKIISGFDISTIINFQLDSEIEKRITEKKIEIDTAKSTGKIINTALLKRITKIDFEIRFEKVIEFLQTSIDTISEKYLKMVNDHKRSLNLATKSEQWIKDGYDNISDNKCPFCLRSFDATVEIINAYKQYFNEEYISLQEKARLLQNKVKTINPELILSNIEKENNHNTGFLEFWGNIALKALLPQFSGKIKCIYIDPPYNTGNEGWIYNDKTNSPLIKEWIGRTVGKDDLSMHDKWLCMIVPRLKLLRDLLCDDGVIFISIDDNEVHDLRRVLDEIFGEECFLGSFVWKKRSGSNDAKDFISIDHEYVLTYRKTEAFTFEGVGKDFSNYQNPDKDDRGDWTFSDLTCNKTKSERPNLCYDSSQAEDKINEAEYFVGKHGKQAIYLVYKQDYETLARLALNLTLAEKIKEQQPGKKRIVYAPSCFLDEEYLTDNQFEYVGIPYNLFQRR